jgi:hypothetical protein
MEKIKRRPFELTDEAREDLNEKLKVIIPDGVFIYTKEYAAEMEELKLKIAKLEKKLKKKKKKLKNMQEGKVGKE